MTVRERTRTQTQIQLMFHLSPYLKLFSKALQSIDDNVRFNRISVLCENRFI